MGSWNLTRVFFELNFQGNIQHLQIIRGHWVAILIGAKIKISLAEYREKYLKFFILFLRYYQRLLFLFFTFYLSQRTNDRQRKKIVVWQIGRSNDRNKKSGMGRKEIMENSERLEYGKSSKSDSPETMLSHFSRVTRVSVRDAGVDEAKSSREWTGGVKREYR